MRYVIADIHGCLNTLQLLVTNLNLNSIDSLYFLGDYIDKGKSSAKVLDYLIDLRTQQNVFFLRGNHEANILETQQNYEPKMFKMFVEKINKSPCLLNNESRIIPKYQTFMQDLPYFLELEDFWLVHAGFSPKENFLDEKDYMLEGRNTQYEIQKFKGKRIVHGHTVTYKQTIERAVQEQASIIPLDNGCVYNKSHKIYDYTQTGNLCCLNLDTFELIWQKNID
ncbi:MAG: serine/threonine protein phosphatase [Cytophagales bacterium]|nr:MAG: serine/threonine protein phosphatase [Cytophagales bacterium]